MARPLAPSCGPRVTASWSARTSRATAITAPRAELLIRPCISSGAGWSTMASPKRPGSRRDTGRLGQTVIDHPAPLEMQRRIDLAAARPVVAVALLVFAEQLAEPVGPELGAKGLAIPPGEDFEQELFHAGCRLLTLDPVVVMPPARRIVQPGTRCPTGGYPMSFPWSRS